MTDPNYYNTEEQEAELVRVNEWRKNLRDLGMLDEEIDYWQVMLRRTGKSEMTYALFNDRVKKLQELGD